jgi:multiple sugar transport system ATP-binding protein
MASVSLENLTRSFDDVVAVSDVSLTIDHGAFLVLLGPSGCGKSTLLRMIAGLVDPTAGTIALDGAVVNDVEPRDRDLAMVFQNYALYPHKTVRANIEFSLLPRKLEAGQRAERVAEAAEMLGLDGLMDRKPKQLSGGQRQRVALARAIVRRPSVFLMDEPLSNLDAKMRAGTRADLVDLHRRLGATFIYVTHDQVEAMTMASQVAVLDHGVLQQVAPPHELYERPANAFVAGFIGTPPMNIVEGAVAERAEEAAVRVGGGDFAVSSALVAAAREHRLNDVVLGVRPEHVVLGDIGLPAQVLVVESLGHERLVVCEVAGGAGRVVARRSVEVAVPKPGDIVHLSAEARHVHLFHPVGGERIDVDPTAAP